MKKLAYLLPVLMLAACGDDSANKNGLSEGRFKATLGETQIDIPVVCGNFESDDAFFFNSDNQSITDTDGDGILVHGSRVKISKEQSSLPFDMDEMSLDITLNGVQYSAGITMPGSEKTASWTKTANGVSGKDQLIAEGGTPGGKYPVSYVVVCE